MMKAVNHCGATKRKHRSYSANLFRGLSLISWLFVAMSGFSSELRIENVRAKQLKDTREVEVLYDLVSSIGGSYDVKIQFVAPGEAPNPMSVRGDIGENVCAGRNKRVIWNAVSDWPENVNSNFHCTVMAEQNNEKVAEWYSLTGNASVGVMKTAKYGCTVPKGCSAYFTVYAYSEEYPVYTGSASQYNDILSYNISAPGCGAMAGSIDVNSLHQAWALAADGAFDADGYFPIAFLDENIFDAPDEKDLDVSIELGAKNVSDSNLPSTIIAGVSYGVWTSGMTAETFVVDTRNDEFKIEDVVSKFCSGEYGKGNHATFLEEVPLTVNFTFNAACKPGQQVDHYLVDGYGGNCIVVKDPVLTVNIDKMKVGDSLMVSAVAKDGEVSKPFKANFSIAPLPNVVKELGLNESFRIDKKDDRVVYTSSCSLKILDEFHGAFDVTELLSVKKAYRLRAESAWDRTFSFMPQFEAGVGFDSSTGMFRIGGLAGLTTGLNGLSKLQKKLRRQKLGTLGGTDMGLAIDGDYIEQWCENLRLRA